MVLRADAPRWFIWSVGVAYQLPEVFVSDLDRPNLYPQRHGPGVLDSTLTIAVFTLVFPSSLSLVSSQASAHASSLPTLPPGCRHRVSTSFTPAKFASLTPAMNQRLSLAVRRRLRPFPLLSSLPLVSRHPYAIFSLSPLDPIPAVNSRQERAADAVLPAPYRLANFPAGAPWPA
ncbi:hypothetical protein K488DRAFT_87609 [Vararia minispora EC-137]|uniref:Uncharacterized protein n=1 Tax=Vararia minispora EC-137 TaxID=1314806 RepID=A0ACB8QH25_9AGAM|nr:hypothetical protein K488DRAFT_87609 [Vararia minispora EC-137]